MTIGLKERTSTYSIARPLRLVSQVIFAGGNENFLRRCLPIAGICLAECYDTGDLRHRRAQLLRPFAHGGAASLARAANINQKLRIVGVGKEFDFPNARGNLAGSSTLPQGGDPPIDKRRTD